MTRIASGEPRDPGYSQRTLLLVCAAVLAVGSLVGAGLVFAIQKSSSSPTALTAATPANGRVDPTTAAAVPKGFAIPLAGVPAVSDHSPPVEVAVPAIAVRSRLVGLRLNADGTLQVPADYGLAGWYSDGPAPGDTGPPAVIVGHVDSKAGPGIFYRLPELHTGDAVLVRRADGFDVRFRVYRTADYPKASFPADKVYAVTKQPELRLITCTGTFDKASGHYTSNRVVYARIAP